MGVQPMTMRPSARETEISRAQKATGKDINLTEVVILATDRLLSAVKIHIRIEVLER